MGDEERANQDRPSHPYPPARSESGEVDIPEATPTHIDEFESRTPPPIIVDDVGRPVTRTRTDSPAPVIVGRRSRKTVQEVVEDLWPARRALQLLTEQLQRIVALETKIEYFEANGPAALTNAAIGSLRAELVGHDGKGGVVGNLAASVARDIADTHEAMREVDKRATKADRFVRRILYGAGGTIIGAVVAAALLIYQAGEKSAESKAEVRQSRQEVTHRIDSIDSALTELKAQVKLLLESQLKDRR